MAPARAALSFMVRNLGQRARLQLALVRMLAQALGVTPVRLRPSRPSSRNDWPHATGRVGAAAPWTVGHALATTSEISTEATTKTHVIDNLPTLKSAIRVMDPSPVSTRCTPFGHLLRMAPRAKSWLVAEQTRLAKPLFQTSP